MAWVAQMVKGKTLYPVVVGSSPILGNRGGRPVFGVKMGALLEWDAATFAVLL